MATLSNRFDATFTSPLRGEVDAYASGEGFSVALGAVSFTATEPLTPTLSPQGRGGEGAAPSLAQEGSHAKV